MTQAIFIILIHVSCINKWEVILLLFQGVLNVNYINFINSVIQIICVLTDFLFICANNVRNSI